MLRDVMADSKSTLEAVRKMIADHASASEFVRNLDRTVAIWNAKEPSAKVNGIRAFVKAHVVEHFAVEDETVFPALLADNPTSTTVRIVAALGNDHRAIRQEVEKLEELLARVERGADADAVAELDLMFRIFLGHLQRHATEEDKLFVSLSGKKI